MSMVGFPLLLIPLAIYNIIAFLMPGTNLAEPLVTIGLMSGAAWPLTLGDVLLSLGILLLLLEIVKGARPGSKYLTDHLLSLIVLGSAAAEFVMLPRFGNSIYGLLTLLALVEFLSGIALHTRRGTLVAAPARVSEGLAREPEVLSEPEFDPVPAASTPSAGVVTEPRFVGRVEPSVQPSMMQPSSPEIASPELQPGHGALPPANEPPR